MARSVHKHLHGSQASLLRQVHSLPTVGITVTQLVLMLISNWIPTRSWQIPLEVRNKVLALIDDVITYIEQECDLVMPNNGNRSFLSETLSDLTGLS